MYGGQSWVRNGTQIPFQVCNHYLRIADFTKARDLSDSSILSAKDIPGNITIYQQGAFWVDEKNVYVVGESANDEPWLSRHGTTYTAGTVFPYSLESEEWDSEPAVQPNSGSEVTDSFCCGAFEYNAAYGRAYFLSGINGAGARRLYPDTVPGYVSPAGGAIFGNGNLFTFDTANFRWTNVATDTQLTTTGTEGGQFVYLPGIEAEKGGVAVIFGGQRRDTQDMESMRKVLVYNSATSTFYGQGTTSDGDFPKGRMQFCAVAASAPDNSSHNIFMYAGESPDATPTAYSDMRILSVPSFRWLKLDVDSPAKKALGCTLVGGKYMFTYGGVSAGWER
ncbi:hypothetical protein BDV96DRAFT_37681 [Lophiotrema nucula]|uniref:Uncharacterized protein n=1 Tax=Lophiotrema nucula TaxID=690887 RepID=A0A6A5ZBN4_9PLEO|nr:hypothetical protein BDV96DRAFT_37681 [Lophiotrema nucula]